MSELDKIDARLRDADYKGGALKMKIACMEALMAANMDKAAMLVGTLEIPARDGGLKITDAGHKILSTPRLEQELSEDVE